jgi:GntR family transcriptional regulator of arabinose operon
MGKDEFWGRITISDTGTIPKYRQLRAEIERLIAENVLTINSRLPGENEFFSQLGLSRTTIRKAFQDLEDTHLIYRVQGQGTFIGSKPAALSENSGKADPGSGRVIGVVVPNITNEIYPFIIEGIEKTLRLRNGYALTAYSAGSHERELRLVNEMLHNSMDGLILEPLYSGIEGKEPQLVSLLESLTIPVVILNNDIPSFECSKVLQDDEGGGRLITGHLLEYGHRRIAYIYNDEIKAGIERRKGYREAFIAAGIPHDSALEIPFNDEQGIVFPGYVLTKQLLEKNELGITAIFYFNDDLALQGIEAARILNMEIPRDLSIVGYDDIPRSRLSGIGLTTVSHPKSLLGSWAASLILEQFDYPGSHIYRTITVHSSMVYRSSVDVPPLIRQG